MVAFRTHDSISEQHRRRVAKDGKFEVRLESPDNAGARVITLTVEAPDEETAKRVAEQEAQKYTRKPYPTAVKATKVSDAEATPPNKPQYTQGNAAYIVTLPQGDYELEDDGGDTVNIVRHKDDGSREFVISLPAGPEYSGKSDSAGFHVFAKAQGEPDIKPLLTGDVAPVALGYGFVEHAKAIAAFNDRHAQKAGDTPTRRALPGTPMVKLGSYVTDRESNRQALRRINTANRRFWRKQ
jgi:hypothetical protein